MWTSFQRTLALCRCDRQWFLLLIGHWRIFCLLFISLGWPVIWAPTSGQKNDKKVIQVKQELLEHEALLRKDADQSTGQSWQEAYCPNSCQSSCKDSRKQFLRKRFWFRWWSVHWWRASWRRTYDAFCPWITKAIPELDTDLVDSVEVLFSFLAKQVTQTWKTSSYAFPRIGVSSERGDWCWVRSGRGDWKEGEKAYEKQKAENDQWQHTSSYIPMINTSVPLVIAALLISRTRHSKLVHTYDTAIFRLNDLNDEGINEHSPRDAWIPYLCYQDSPSWREFSCLCYFAYVS